MTDLVENVVRRVLANEPDPDDDIGELEIAEYVVFLLALDTYIRYVEEHAGEGMEDDLIRKGIQLVRLADRRHLAAIHTFLGDSVPTPGQKKMLDKAFRFLPTNTTALGRRTWNVKTVMSRGGAATMRAVFKTNKALQEVKAAMAAASIEDADAALDKFAVIAMKNQRLRKWIDDAAELAGSGTFQNAVSAGAQAGDDAIAALSVAKVEQHAAPLLDQGDLDQGRQDALLEVQQQAQESAQRAMAVSGEPDEPPKKSEVVGIATAAVTSMLSNPALSPVLREVFTVGGRELDDEQKAAVVADGRVLVAAGAGAGKSTTLVSRLKYLLRVKKASPSRIFATTFNRKAKEDLAAKAEQELGSVADAIAIGTMHSLFRKFIRGGHGVRAFGNASERAMISDENLIGKSTDEDDEPSITVEGDESAGEPGGEGRKRIKPPSTSQMTFAVRGIIKDLGPAGLSRMTGLPPKLFEDNPDVSSKECKQWMENWRGNGVDFTTARVGAVTFEELMGSVWMELYYGLKGDLDKPGRPWEPVAPSGTFGRFMTKFRPPPERRKLGDPDDMIRIFRDILKRDPEARRTAQGMYDHILVDEAQDLNVVQHEVFRMMTEHITPESSGKSFWIVGDDKQSIYQFRGAVPKNFSGLHDPESGFASKLIQTNYRCDPEIVEAANRLSQHNTGQIPMQAKADPTRARSRATINVETPADYTDGAYRVISSYAKDQSLSGEPWTKFAVLSRTNAELNTFEDQCILHEIPYKRSKGKGFLESRESNVVMGYLDLAMSSDYEEMKEALLATIGKPDRELYMSPDAIDKIVRDSFKAIARAENIDVRNLNPLDLITRPQLARKLATALKEPTKARRIADARKMEDRYPGARWLRDKMREYEYEWMWQEDIDKLQDHLLEMGRQVLDLRKAVQAGATTTDMLNRILDGVSVEVGYYNRKSGQDTRKRVTLKQQLKEDIAFNRDPEEDDTEGVKLVVKVDEAGVRRVIEVDEETGEEREVDPLQGLGTVRYLYQLAEPNDNDKALGIDPQKGSDFYRKIDRYKQLSKQLQDPKKHPDRLSLSTIHSVKGAQWKHVALCMSEGFFPPKRKTKVTGLAEELAKIGAEIPWPPEQRDAAVQAAHAHIDDDPMRAERNLAYVGVTRAESDLTVICSQERVTSKSPEPVVSIFVREAGLHIGENVKPPPPPGPEVVETVVEEAAPDAVKTAWVHDHDESGAEVDRYASYDRRLS